MIVLSFEFLLFNKLSLTILRKTLPIKFEWNFVRRSSGMIILLTTSVCLSMINYALQLCGNFEVLIDRGFLYTQNHTIIIMYTLVWIFFTFLDFYIQILNNIHNLIVYYLLHYH